MGRAPSQQEIKRVVRMHIQQAQPSAAPPAVASESTPPCPSRGAAAGGPSCSTARPAPRPILLHNPPCPRPTRMLNSCRMWLRSSGKKGRKKETMPTCEGWKAVGWRGGQWGGEVRQAGSGTGAMQASLQWEGERSGGVGSGTGGMRAWKDGGVDQTDHGPPGQGS